jgi:hypothetical protein
MAKKGLLGRLRVAALAAVAVMEERPISAAADKAESAVTFLIENILLLSWRRDILISTPLNYSANEFICRKGRVFC